MFYGEYFCSSNVCIRVKKNLYICTDFQFYSVVLAIEDYVNVCRDFVPGSSHFMYGMQLNAGWGLGTKF